MYMENTRGRGHRHMQVTGTGTRDVKVHKRAQRHGHTRMLTGTRKARSVRHASNGTRKRGYMQANIERRMGRETLKLEHMHCTGISYFIAHEQDLLSMRISNAICEI